jgi:hypothetical protein
MNEIKLQSQQSANAKLEFKTELKECLKSKIESSSIIAFPNMVKSKHKLGMVIWLFCLLVSCSLCGWFIYSSIVDYFQYRIVTTTNIRYQNQLIFPIVSICNLNPYTTEYATDYIRSHLSNTLKNPILKVAKDHYASIYFAQPNSSDLFNKSQLGSSLSDIIISCSFQKKPCNLTECFEPFYDVNYGNCFRYNSGRNFYGKPAKQNYVTQSGKDYGLDLEVFFLFWIYYLLLFKQIKRLF